MYYLCLDEFLLERHHTISHYLFDMIIRKHDEIKATLISEANGKKFYSLSVEEIGWHNEVIVEESEDPNVF